MNQIAGIECPSVICRRYGPAFGWQDPEQPNCWHMADALPSDIAAALPAFERERCERHAHRRMGERE